MNTYETLQKFSTDNIQQASLCLLHYLGIKTEVITEEPISILELTDTPSKMVTDICSKIEKSFMVCSITDETFDSIKDNFIKKEDRNNGGKYDQIMVFAVDIAPDQHINRTEIACLTRTLNRIAKSAPVMLVCRYMNDKNIRFALSLCERTEYVQAGHTGEKAGKVNILRDINPITPHTGHIRILERLRLDRSDNSFETVYKKWFEVFDNDKLTEDFYKELQNWFFWALKPESGVSFPNDINDDNDDKIYNPQNIIRLITRLIFVWFLREKGLVPKQLFNREDLQKIVKDFEPDNFESNTYYRVILQNLFFATLNKKIEERAFISDDFIVNRNQGKHKIKTFMRHASDLKISKEEFIELMRPVPFMNNSLFECLDNKEQNGHSYNWDGFSDSNAAQRQAFIPNYLFFAKEEYVDLSQEYDRRNTSSTKVFGLLNILKRYQFTVEENTPLDQDVALDPELLGKVFENLLAAYNPETEQTVRKSTGSYYTPRSIVQYMVDESLVSYLKANVTGIDEESVRSLLSYSQDEQVLNLTEEQRKEIVLAVFNCRILDPACGSGAFPMGMLQQMNHLLSKIDSNNTYWEQVVMTRALNDVSFVEKGDDEEKEIRRQEILEVFKFSADNPDYSRKLYLIENCIYGVDLQSIAVQISRLRFFISLVCEQEPDFSKPEKNYNIKPLPNLEMKFVSANSLIRLEHIEEARELFANKDILELISQLKAIRHELFIVSNQHTKEQLLAKDETLRNRIMLSTGELYIKDTKRKIKQKKETIAILHDNLAEAQKMSSELVTVVSRNLFGEETETQTFSSRERVVKDITSRINKVEREIKRLEDSLTTGQDKAIKLARQLTDWNPYDQNQSSSFFDAEWMFGISNGFDIVIGNPPYIVSYDMKYVSYKTYKCHELYAYFFEKGINELKTNGTLAYITASLYVKGLKFDELRNFIVNNSHLISFRIEGDKVFENVGMPTSTIILQKRQDNLWSFENLYEKGNVINKIGNHTKLKDISKIMRGYEIGRSMVTKTGEIKILTGSNVMKWIPKSYSYISNEINERYSKNEYYFKGERIYIRETGSTLTALSVDYPLICNRSLYSIKLIESSFDFKYVTAILNSKIMQYYYSTKFKSETNLFPKIRIAQVKELPIVKVSEKEQRYIAELVDSLSNKLSVGTSIVNDEDYIDLCLYKLYNLSYDEIKEIDPAIEIEKETYERFVLGANHEKIYS